LAGDFGNWHLNSALTRYHEEGTMRLARDVRIMARKKIVRIGGDVREHPQYSLEEVSRYLHIPLSTMKAWCRGQHYTEGRTGRLRHFHQLIKPADPHLGLLSFYNLAEAHILRATRDKKVPLPNVRRALDFVRSYFPACAHSLLSYDFSVSGKEMFIEHLGKTINATLFGQEAMRELLEQYLERIDRDNLGMPIQIYPMNTETLAINPTIASGQPVVKGTRVMAAVLVARRNAGESYRDLIRDYSLTRSQIEQAITEYAA
jgi:uncharacterized protein (DUF433 family)